MLFGIDSSPCILSFKKRSLSNYKKLAFHKSSLQKLFVIFSIPIEVMGINGDYFHALSDVLLCSHSEINSFAKVKPMVSERFSKR